MNENKNQMTRRQAIRLGAAASTVYLLRPVEAAKALGSIQQAKPTATDVDHLMWGVSDLDEGIAYIEEKTGVKAVFGGQHPNRGTRNALISLGDRQYLEILAPDPAQPDVEEGRVTELKALANPRIMTWAAGTKDIQAVEKGVLAADLESMGIQSGSRKKPDGTMLKWRNLTVGGHDNYVVPFVIEWVAGSVHPSEDSPKGCKLRELQLQHPDPDQVNSFLEAMGLKVRAVPWPEARITAVIESPKGEFELT
jgi:hypothetical protein